MRQRDHKAEYRRRIERGLARGLSLSQARGHPKADEKPIESIRPKVDPDLEAAIKAMNRGKSLTAAARSHHVSAERLRRSLRKESIAKKGANRRWVMADTRPRRVPVMTNGKVEQPLVAGYEEARLAGAHHRAAGEFVRTNDIEHLKPFERRTVRTTSGREIPLETDPNALHRIAATDTPPFHEIYEIVSVN